MKVSVIGLGAMGAGMAANLHKAGCLAYGWNRTAERGKEAADKQGFNLADTMEEAVKGADIVITSVSTDADLMEVSETLTSKMQPGSIMLDTSTVSSDTARHLSKNFARTDVHFLDAPVSGGKEGADKGTLVMMVGGDPSVLDQARPVLEHISIKVIHMGDVGSGQATKAVNQIMCAGINQAVTEALAFGQSQQLDMNKVVDVVSGGAADNWFVRHRGKSMCAGTYEPGFRLGLHHKDLKICQAMLNEQHVKLSIVEQTLKEYEKLMASGHGDEDISALFRLKQTLFHA